MPDLLAQLDAAANRGDLLPWKAALLREWLLHDCNKDKAGPTPEDLARLLLDPPTLARLKDTTDGPWDALVAQSRSILAHAHVGAALADIEPK